jgi:hypothetical protein
LFLSPLSLILFNIYIIIFIDYITHNFINPEDKEAHTQGVDGLAGIVKANIRGMRGLPASGFQGHISLFLLYLFIIYSFFLTLF